MTTTGSNDDDDDDAVPRFEIICTITSPITSSIIAALPKTTPRRVLARPVVERIVKVVPMLVEQSAAPAANACRGVAESRDMRINERPMGTPTPVVATSAEKIKLDFTWAKEVDSPPINH